MVRPNYKFYKIHNLTKEKALNSLRLLAGYDESKYGQALEKIDAAYLPWEEFRKKSWTPDDHKEQTWYLVQFFRARNQTPIGITDQDGNQYRFNPQRHARFIHEIDLEFGGNMIGLANFNESDKRQIIRRNLEEESIASSKLEGANTSRETARRMLREGRKPKDRSERMIANNHKAMLSIDDQLKNQPMSMQLLIDLHRLVTHDTLSNPELEGKLRETLDSKGNRLIITPWDETTVTYLAPNREFVEEQLPLLIKFANDEDESGFIHPLFKAIILHFWIGLLHPFEDGNGRLARIIFYWYMLRKGYWAFAYLSLSERILKSPKQYAMAYIYSEQDNYDLNYFIQYNVEKLQLAREDLQKYLEQRIAENKRHHQLLQGKEALNERQFRLLQHLAIDEVRHTSVTGYHTVNHAIGYITAVSDLKNLVERGLLRKVKTGRNVNYFATSKVESLFK